MVARHLSYTMYFPSSPPENCQKLNSPCLKAQSKIISLFFRPPVVFFAKSRNISLPQCHRDFVSVSLQSGFGFFAYRVNISVGKFMIIVEQVHTKCVWYLLLYQMDVLLIRYDRLILKHLLGSGGMALHGSLLSYVIGGINPSCNTGGVALCPKKFKNKLLSWAVHNHLVAQLL